MSPSLERLETLNARAEARSLARRVSTELRDLADAMEHNGSRRLAGKLLVAADLIESQEREIEGLRAGRLNGDC